MKQLFYILKTNVPFHILTLISVALIIASWFVPPLGIIDGSVIASVGELFAFAGLWTVIKAIDKGMDASVKHNQTELNIKGKKSKKEAYETIDNN